MKSNLFRKTAIAILTVLLAVCVMLGGLSLRTKQNAIAAVDKPTTVTLTADKTELVPGGTFNLTMEISTTRVQNETTAKTLGWFAVSVYLGYGKVNDADDDISDKVFYTNQAELEWKGTVNTASNAGTYENASTADADEDNPVSFASNHNYMFNTSYSPRRNGTHEGNATKDTTVAYTLSLKVAEDDSLIGKEFALKVVEPFALSFMDQGETKRTEVVEEFENVNFVNVDPKAGNVDLLKFTIKEASKEAKLTNLEAGIDSANLASVTLPDDAELTAKPNGPHEMKKFEEQESLDGYTVKLEAVAGAAMKVGKIDWTTDSTGAEAAAVVPDANGCVSFSTPDNLPTEGGKIYIRVTAEDGVTVRDYVLTVINDYLRLTDLTVDTKTQLNKTDHPLLKNGLGTEDGSGAWSETPFDPEVFEYVVAVPDDSVINPGDAKCAVDIVATILPGYNTSETIGLAATGCNASTATNDEIASGANLLLTDIENDATLEFTLTSKEGDTPLTKTYKLTFKVLETNTDYTIKAVSPSDSTKEFDDDATKATENSVDHYFALRGETSNTANVIIEKTEKRTIVFITTDASNNTNSAPYDSSKAYELDTYTVSIQTEAGNTKNFKFILANAEVLELTADSKYAFLYEEEEPKGSWSSYTRKTYQEKSWTHGVEDILPENQVDRIIIGQISAGTSIVDFLQNIIESQRDRIQVYGFDRGTDPVLLYDCGAPADGYTDASLATARFYVGTGWYVKFMEETVYLSVLGDVNGDGLVNSRDVSTMNSVLMGLETFTTTEIRLASYIVNSGAFNARDVSTMNSILMGLDDMEYYFYQPASGTES